MTASGGVLLLEECFTYTSGREPDTVCLRMEWSTEIYDYVCKATVNGNQQCNSCIYESCDGGTRPRVDCTNLPEGEVLSRCTEDAEKSNPHSGIFTIINDNVLCAADEVLIDPFEGIPAESDEREITSVVDNSGSMPGTDVENSGNMSGTESLWLLVVMLLLW